MKVLVTGGAGYIGSLCCKFLEKSGFKVIVVDNFSTGFKELARWGKIYKCDLRNLKKLREVFEQEKDIKVVLHFASYSIVSQSQEKPLLYWENNLVGLINLLNLMKEFGVKNIVFSSTAAVYGVSREIPITEDEKTAPINVYGKTKLVMEEIIKDSGFNYIIFRYFNACGADFNLETGEMHNPETHLIPNLIKAALLDEKFYLFGDDFPTFDGTCIRDYIDVNDLARAHLLAVKYLIGGRESNILNLGTGKGNSNLEILRLVESLTNKKINLEIKEKREFDPPVLVASFSKAKEVLGWEPNINIEDSINNAVLWFKKINNL